VKKLFLIGGVIIAAAALGILLYSSFNTNTPYVLTPAEFAAKQNSYSGKQVRVEGIVAQDTVDWTSNDYPLKFILQDQDRKNKITVFYRGEKQDPNKFIEGIKIMVEGKFSNGILAASLITYECPNEYKDK
jgi:cytochrome c-type biogenesis protein CcmE